MSLQTIEVLQLQKSQGIEALSPNETWKFLAATLAGNATLEGKGNNEGKFLVWPEFNKNVELEIVDWMAKVLIDQVEQKGLLTDISKPEEIMIFPIEAAGDHLAGSIARLLKESLGFEKPPDLIRIQKKAPEEMMVVEGGIVVSETVIPDTTNGKPRTMTAVVHKPDKYKYAQLYLVVDDFVSSGASIWGGDVIAQGVLEALGVDQRVSPTLLAGITKRAQMTGDDNDFGGRLISALTIKDFGFDPTAGEYRIDIDGFEGPLSMTRMNQRLSVESN